MTNETPSNDAPPKPPEAEQAPPADTQNMGEAENKPWYKRWFGM